ncbi:MAG: helix-turn-helix transcriptional regulator [Roseibium sp.]|nr:helix-turn-helix transcriptional regulator [Roseibium sp.]
MTTIQPETRSFRKSGGNMKPNERLKHARVKAGFRSAAAAADAMGMRASTYQAHENGNRNFDADDAKRYGRVFGISPEWLLFGTKTETTPQDSLEQPVINAPAELDFFSNKKRPLDLDTFLKARTIARELEAELTGGGVVSYNDYKVLLINTYNDLLLRRDSNENDETVPNEDRPS